MSNACFLLEDADGEPLGYFRSRENGEAAARNLRLAPGWELVLLDPPDPIACEDDSTGN